MSNTFRQIFRLTTFVAVSFFLLMIPAARSDEAKTIHVLFIGNSLTTANNLPKLVADLAKSRQHPMEYDVYAPGGKDLSEHASDPVTLNKIKENAWDFIVLQEQGQRPAFSEWEVQQKVYPFARQLSEAVKAANPQARVIFYMTMARRDGDPRNIHISPELGTYEGMQDRINQSYVNMGMDNRALVAPVGLVWEKVREQYPSIDLYADETHPNLTGTYLAACVFYSVFFNDTSAGLAHPSVIDGQTASAIQNVTDEIIKLPGWNWEVTGGKLATPDTSEMPDQKPTSASAQDIEKFIGTWIADGKEFLVIKSKDGLLEIGHPEDLNSKRRSEFKNIRVENDKLRFEVSYYAKDGSQDPNNGKVTYVEMKQTSEGKMYCSLSAREDMKDVGYYDHIILTNSQNKNVQETSAHLNPDAMKFLLVFQSGHLPDGATSYKTDLENKIVQYFDQDGRLFMERYLDEHNDIVTKKYNTDAQVISEHKITQGDIMEGSDRAQIAHEEQDIPLIKSILQTLSTAAENYAKANNGQYPAKMQDLTEAESPYLGVCTCDQTVEMYRIKCDVSTSGYEFIAHSIWSHYESYVISTGGKLGVKKTGELGRAIPFQASKSPCGSK